MATFMVRFNQEVPADIPDVTWMRQLPRFMVQVSGLRTAGFFRQSTRWTDSCLKPSRDRLPRDAMMVRFTSTWKWTKPSYLKILRAHNYNLKMYLSCLLAVSWQFVSFKCVFYCCETLCKIDFTLKYYTYYYYASGLDDHSCEASFSFARLCFSCFNVFSVKFKLCRFKWWSKLWLHKNEKDPKNSPNGSSLFPE